MKGEGGGSLDGETEEGGLLSNPRPFPGEGFCLTGIRPTFYQRNIRIRATGVINYHQILLHHALTVSDSIADAQHRLLQPCFGLAPDAPLAFNDANRSRKCF